MASTDLRVPGRRFLPPDPRVTEPYRLSPQTAFRIGILGALALAAFGVLFLRLWSLQVLSSDRYLEAAQNNQVRTLPLEAPRGSILDREGHPLVTNKPGTAVRIWVADLPRKRRYQELRLLSRVLSVPLPEVLAKIERKKRDPLTPVTIKEDVPEDEVMYILERRSQFPGVFVDDTSLRHYPQGVLASQLVGHVGEVTDVQLEERDGVRLGEKIGQSGVEAAFDRYLRGTMGSAQLRVDSLGRPTSDIEQTAPATPGLSVRLTLDVPLQRAAEQALEYGIQQTQVVHKNWYANGGAIVALDPRDGAIRALASHPEYDPRVYSEGAQGPHGRRRGRGEELPVPQPRSGREISAWIDVQARDRAGRRPGRPDASVLRTRLPALVLGQQGGNERRRPGLQELELPGRRRKDDSARRARRLLRHLLL
jgi:penicillin-binding protein 2